MFTYVIVRVDDKIQSTKRCGAPSCYNYSTWKLLASCLYILSGQSYRCNFQVGVSCVRE